jgi:probable F420-dependent oxidoreductase
MKFGIAMFCTAGGLHPGELAALVEDRGFESLWFPDHTHIPVASQGTFPWRDHQVPVEYRELYDPFVALTVAAGATSSLKLGTGVCLVIERDPIVTAKTVASLDSLSGGRVLFGVGAGWNRHEMSNHGTDPGRRFKLMRERVQAMQAIWTEDRASYEGEFVSFHDIWSWPKPAQRPHPPILIGGNGPHAVERVLAYGDEWLPEPEPGLGDRIADLHEGAREAGRRVPVTVYSGDPASVHEYEEWGAHRCCFWVPPNDPEGARRKVDEIASAVGLR